MGKPRVAIMDLYYMDTRSKLMDIAAFMDRVERFGETDDYRYRAFVQTLAALQSANRAETVLTMLSDPTEAPCEKAGRPAAGAYPQP